MDKTMSKPLLSDDDLWGPPSALSPSWHPFVMTARQVRDLYEEDRAKWIALVQTLVDGVDTMRQGAFADKYIYADAERLFSLAAERGITPSRNGG